ILSNHYVEDVYFVDNSTGWVVGENGLIIKTTNGGTSWDVQNSGTSNSLHSIHFIDQNIGWAVGDDATILHTTNGGVTFVNKKEIDEEPIDFSLEQNYPNPFNPSTKINFEIPGQARNDNTLVTLKVYDVLGNEIATLISEEKQPGTYEVEFDGTALPSGIYFYKLKAGYFVETKKMILLR
ncbi:MAG: YCF48-related protein, partial [Ignavibacteriaceae bacterium]